MLGDSERCVALSIVLPFYNEEACVEQVISEIHSALSQIGIGFEIVAVQNGSQDHTSQILASLQKQFPELCVVDVPINRGFGYGVIQGLGRSTGKVIGYMPGDGQIAPFVLPLLLQRIEQTQADICKGRRVVRRDGWYRWFISKAYNWIARFLFQLPTDDVNGHPKLMTRQAFSTLRLSSHDHFIDAELMLKAKVLQLKISEVDLEFQKRATGHSKVRLFAAGIEFLRNMLRVRFSKARLWEVPHEE
jgi:glycosyltransferase involved in cell wall biosynthesis